MNQEGFFFSHEQLFFLLEKLWSWRRWIAVRRKRLCETIYFLVTKYNGHRIRPSGHVVFATRVAPPEPFLFLRLLKYTFLEADNWQRQQQTTKITLQLVRFSDKNYYYLSKNEYCELFRRRFCSDFWIILALFRKMIHCCILKRKGDIGSNKS